MRIREAVKFGSLPAVLALWAWGVGYEQLGVLFGLLAAFVVYFFRDPERQVPSDPAVVVAPADGRVVQLVEESHEGQPGIRLSIFLSLWDVHVNRAPVGGRLARVERRSGRFHLAFRPEASVENEQSVLHFETDRGPLVVKQIAGWLARRVVVWKQEGDMVTKGERIGMIRFGSRVDLWLPQSVQVVVQPGEHVRAGSSVVAYW